MMDAKTMTDEELTLVRQAYSDNDDPIERLDLWHRVQKEIAGTRKPTTWKVTLRLLATLDAKDTRIRELEAEALTVGLDRDGAALYVGDIVLHDNGLMPPGRFRIAWDAGKVGYVLLGVGVSADYWLADWCPGHTTKERNPDEATG